MSNESGELKLFGCLAYQVIGIGSVFVWAWAVWLLWGWFLAPLGMPVLSKSHTYGLILLVGLLTKSIDWYAFNEKEHSRVERLSMAIGEGLCRPVLAAGIGWIVKNYFMAQGQG